MKRLVIHPAQAKRVNKSNTSSALGSVYPFNSTASLPILVAHLGLSSVAAAPGGYLVLNTDAGDPVLTASGDPVYAVDFN